MFEGNFFELIVIKLVFGLDLFIYFCLEDLYMEWLRNEIIGDNLIIVFLEYYFVGFKIFVLKIKYIRDSCEFNEDFFFLVSYKYIVLIGYFFFFLYLEIKVLMWWVNDRCL